MIRVLYRAPDGTLRTDVEPKDLSRCLSEKDGLLWVDFEGETPERCEPILRQTFGFHALAVDDALQETHVPKIDDWGGYVYIALHAVGFDQGGGQIETREFDVFLGHNYLVSHHDLPVRGVERVAERCRRDDRALKERPDHLLYLILDELVAAYLQVFEDMDDVFDVLEAQIFEQPTTRTLERIFAIKRAILNLRRVIAPQREVLNKLARDDFAVIDAHDRVYFRDVYDHLVRLFDINESMRDQVGGALDTYLSVINNRMNDIMKTLTVITTLFMPISFVAGFFGMNFFQPDGSLQSWTSHPTFLAMLAITMLTPVRMLLWIRRRGWM